MPYTSSCLVFKKSNSSEDFHLKQPDNKEIENFFSSHSKRTVIETYSKYCTLDPLARLRDDVRSDMSDHLEYLVENHQDYFGSIQVNSQNFSFTEFIYFHDFSFKFVVNIALTAEENIVFKLIESDQLTNNRKVVDTIKCKVLVNETICFEHKAKANKVYAVSVGMVKKSDVPLKSIKISVKLTEF